MPPSELESLRKLVIDDLAKYPHPIDADRQRLENLMRWAGELDELNVKIVAERDALRVQRDASKVEIAALESLVKEQITALTTYRDVFRVEQDALKASIAALKALKAPSDAQKDGVQPEVKPPESTAQTNPHIVIDSATRRCLCGIIDVGGKSKVVHCWDLIRTIEVAERLVEINPVPSVIPPDLLNLALAVKDCIKDCSDTTEPPKSQSYETAPPKSQDCDVDTARSLHRVVRALYTGHCPRCGKFWQNINYGKLRGWSDCERCPECGFAITHEEAAAALAEFAPIMRKNLEVFEQWRKERNAQGDKP